MSRAEQISAYMEMANEYSVRENASHSTGLLESEMLDGFVRLGWISVTELEQINKYHAACDKEGKEMGDVFYISEVKPEWEAA